MSDVVPVKGNFTVEPERIVSTLQNCAVKSTSTTSTTTQRISDIAHAKLLSGRVQLMDGLWIVDDSVRTNNKFTVKLSDSSCSCIFPNCIHLMAVRFAAGLNVAKPKRTNLSAQRRRCRSCKKQAEPHAACLLLTQVLYHVNFMLLLTAAEHHRPLAGTKLYCLVTEAHRSEQLA